MQTGTEGELGIDVLMLLHSFCMEKIPCSVLILTRNSAATLEKCLKNLSAFGEILIHDANSEDDRSEEHV